MHSGQLRLPSFWDDQWWYFHPRAPTILLFPIGKVLKKEQSITKIAPASIFCGFRILNWKRRLIDCLINWLIVFYSTHNHYTINATFIVLVSDMREKKYHWSWLRVHEHKDINFNNVLTHLCPQSVITDAGKIANFSKLLRTLMSKMKTNERYCG